MVETIQCPTHDELIRLNSDKLSDERSEMLFDHIEQCETCAEFFGDLEDPEDQLGERLAQIKLDDLDRARQAIEADTLRETATSIWGKVSPMLKSRDQKPSLEIPCQLGQYEITRLIDSGGMGEVYEAHHVRLKRPVAIKVILGYRQEDPDTHQHFLKEMETAGQLEHPNLVRAYDAWEHEGCLFLAQELLVGDSLQNLVNKGEFGGPREVLDAVLETCRALEQLHEKEFIHRDVKPANIMRLEDGKIKLIDYGLAIAADTRRSMIRVGAGTMGYMSPEQAHGGHPIDQRTDIYAAGRVLKYLLSKCKEKAISRKDTQLVEHLESLADRMTKLDPEDRFQNVYAVVVKLEQLKKAMEAKRTRGTTGTKKKAKADPQSPPVDVKPPASPIPESPSTVSAALPTTVADSPPQLPGVQVTLKPDSPRRPQVNASRNMLLAGVIAVLVFMAGAWASYELIFKTDRQATVLVKNHKDGDVIRITSKDGQVREVDLTGDPKFEVGPGTYKIALKKSSNRRINPGNLEITGRDRLTVMIEDNPTDVATDFAKPRMEPGPRKTAGNPSKKQTSSKGTLAPADASPQTKELLAARKKQSEQLSLPVTLTVGFKGNSSFHEMEFVLIPCGKFLMGAPDSSQDFGKYEPRPAHEVIITHPFYISRYEVTQKQFRDVFGAGLTPVNGDGTQYPATQIMWTACVEHCKRLTAQGTNLPDGATVRLPTEAEWEYACRAGTTTRFWWGDTIRPDQASLRLSGRPMRLEPVDSFAPNPFGLYNVHGNLWEWCSDWLGPDYYQTSPPEDPQGPANGTLKVVRGGSWSNTPPHLTYFRFGYAPNTRSQNIGFRPVIDLKDVKGVDAEIRNNNIGFKPLGKLSISTDWKGNKEQQRCALHFDVPVEYKNSVEMKFRLIPPGQFMIGSPKSEYGRNDSNEFEPHPVKLTKPFYMSVTEVTQGQWKKVMGSSPWKDDDVIIDGDEFPACHVSRKDAREFCRRLGLKADDGRTYRLPTEAEWEWACRAGTQTAFFFGEKPDKLSDYAWFRGNSMDQSLGQITAHRVAQKLPNPFGLYDMYGNVWEFTKEEHLGIAGPELVDPKVLTNSKQAIQRGGDWAGPPEWCRSAKRSGVLADQRGRNYGFRVVCELFGD